MAYRGPIVAPSGARQPCALAALSPSPRMPAGPHRTPGRGPPTRPHRPPPACCPRLRLPGTPPAPSPNDPCHSHVDPTAATARRRAPPAPLTRARWKSWCARRTASTRRWGRWCGTTWSERGRVLLPSRAGRGTEGWVLGIATEAHGTTRAVPEEGPEAFEAGQAATDLEAALAARLIAGAARAVFIVGAIERPQELGVHAASFTRASRADRATVVRVDLRTSIRVGGARRVRANLAWLPIRPNPTVGGEQVGDDIEGVGGELVALPRQGDALGDPLAGLLGADLVAEERLDGAPVGGACSAGVHAGSRNCWKPSGTPTTTSSSRR